MGNGESTLDGVDGSLSRHSSHRHHSQSPAPQRRSSSFNRKPLTHVSLTKEEQPLRRAKTCRQKERSVRRPNLCLITGLTPHQKALLSRKWRRMDRGTIHELGRRVFEEVFQENAAYLRLIGLEDKENWAQHINFRIHTQRFVTALQECMRRLREPAACMDVLRDFGALYADPVTSSVEGHTQATCRRVPPAYWDRLAHALSEAAKQLQESDHLTLERVRSRNEEGEARTPVSTTSRSPSHTPSQMPKLVASSSPSHLTVLTERESSRSSTETTTLLSGAEQTSNRDSSSPSPQRLSPEDAVCPITAEAWDMLSLFVANQIRFGYELERILQAEMTKLGLNNKCGKPANSWAKAQLDSAQAV